MISNDLIQAAVIAKLQGNTALVNFLVGNSAGDEIREVQWQGRGFVYPAVRAAVGTQTPGGNGPCYTVNGETAFTVMSFSELGSSEEADQLAGLVKDALLGLHIVGTGFRTGPVLSDGHVHATRTGERVWQAVTTYRMQIYGGSP